MFRSFGYFLVVIFLLVVSSCKISGTITENGVGLEGVTIILKGDRDFLTSTDENGAYTFDHVTPGTYEVIPSKAYYRFDKGSAIITKSDIDSDGYRIDFEATRFTPKAVTLIWDANTEPDLVGYKLYYKVDSTGGGPYTGRNAVMDGQTTDSPINVGNVTEVTIEVASGLKYFFVVTAYNNFESDYSNEVMFDAGIND